MLSSDLIFKLSLAWAFSFFVVRVVPLPYLIYAFVTNVVPGCTLTATWMHVLSLVTLPIPILLNSYWFYLIVSSAMKQMNKKTGTKEK